MLKIVKIIEIFYTFKFQVTDFVTKRKEFELL